MRYAHVWCVCVYTEAKEQISCSVTLHYIPSTQGLSLNLELSWELTSPMEEALGKGRRGGWDEREEKKKEERRRKRREEKGRNGGRRWRGRRKGEKRFRRRWRGQGGGREIEERRDGKR